MEAYLTALGIIFLGALLQSSTYVPLSMVNEWSWESFSFVRGIVIYMVLPSLAATKLALPSGYLFYEMFDEIPVMQVVSTIALGLIWGAADLFYERSMFYLGASRGRALSSALTGVAGIGLAALVMHTFFYHSHPESGISLSVVAGMVVALAGYYLIGKAGDRKDREIRSDQDADRRQFDMKKGILLAITGGVMGACLNVAMVTGDGIFLPETLVAYRWLPALFLFCIGAFISNTAICIAQNIRNRTFYEYSQPDVWKMNLIICVLTGVAEFAALYGFCIGRTFFKDTPLMLFAFLVLLVSQTLFSYMWELIVNEWHGISRKTERFLIGGIILLLMSVIVPALLDMV